MLLLGMNKHDATLMSKVRRCFLETGLWKSLPKPYDRRRWCIISREGTRRGSVTQHSGVGLYGNYVLQNGTYVTLVESVLVKRVKYFSFPYTLCYVRR